MDTIYTRVLVLAGSRGATIQTVETDCGLSNGSIKKWEKSSPSVNKIYKVAKYFNVTIEYLLGETSYKNQYDEWEQKYKNNQEMGDTAKHIKTTDAIAKHLEDKELTDEKIEAFLKYADLLFDKKK